MEKLILSCGPIAGLWRAIMVLVLATGLSSAAENKKALVARPLNYDTELGAYVLSLSIGTPPQPVGLTFDVESSAVTKLTCRTHDNGSATPTSGSFDPSASSTFLRLGKTGGEDTVTLTDLRTQFSPTTSTAAVDGVDVRCWHHSHGVAGFGRGPESLPEQVTRQAGLPLQFAYCLPGVVIFGRPEAYAYLHTFYLVNMSASTGLAHTRLLVDKDDGSYAVVLRNVTVAGGPGYAYTGKPLSLRISTREPYTKLRRSAYSALRSAFRQAIDYGGFSPAQPAVPPFDTCFDPRPIYNQGGPPYPYPSHPLIVFELGDGASWTITPRNSFVSVGTANTVCLGFVDAGPKQPSVLGTFQQQDWLLQFDLEHSMLSFTSIFRFQERHPSTCSDIYS